LSNQQGSGVKSGKITKKHILIATISLIVTGLIVVAVLVGIHLVMEGNKENLKLSLLLKDSGAVAAKQNVSTDANANIIISHIVMDGLDVTINDDFDKDIQLLKIRTDLGVGCFVTPLNRTHAFDPKSLPIPSDYQAATQNKQEVNTSSMGATHMSYDVAPTPINDTTFLGKRANELCANIPIYWLEPICTGPATTTAVSDHVRTKRGFSCGFKWNYCTTTIKIWFIRKTVTYICGGGVQCCLGSFCVSANTRCEACLKVGTWQGCASIC
jgi:hypothetical protein